MPLAPKSLSTHLLVLAGLLAGLGLSGTVALVAATTHLHRIALDIGGATESLRLAEEIQAALLSSHHTATMSLLIRDPAQATQAAEHERLARRRLAEAGWHSRGETERAALRRLDRHMRLYFDELGSVAAPGAAREVRLQAINRAFVPTFAIAEELVELDLEQAREARRQSHVARWIDGGAIATGLVILGVLFFFAIRLRTLFYLPFVGTREAIRRFVSYPEARVPETGAQEWQEIARAFNGIADELARERENQLTCLAAIAHDLRNPIAAIIGTCQFVRPDRPLPEEEELREMFDIAGRSGQRLHRMVADLLDSARLELGRLPLSFEPWDARDVVRAVTRLHPVSAKNQLRVVLPELPVPILADAGRLEQAVGNLLSNAIKYSPDGTPVDIVLEATAAGIELSVTDSGLGIPESDKQTIFEPFMRSSANALIPGIGLGLALTKRIIEAHGGTITLTSRQGAGSTFKVVLPARPAGFLAGSDSRDPAP